MNTEKVVANMRECLQRKFYGVYALLSLKALKTYNLSLEEVIVRRPSEAYDTLKSLTGNCGMSTLIFKECVASILAVDLTPSPPLTLHVTS